MLSFWLAGGDERKLYDFMSSLLHPAPSTGNENLRERISIYDLILILINLKHISRRAT